MTDFTEKYSASAHNGSAAATVKLIEGYDDDEDRAFRFVQIGKGQLVERETTDGDVVEVLDFDDEPGDMFSIGSVDVVEPLTEALQELADNIEIEQKG